MPMMSRSGIATSAAMTRLLSGPAKATSACPWRPWRRFMGLTGVGLAQPKRRSAAAERAEDGRQAEDEAAHLVEVGARVERHATRPAGRVVTQAVGGPGVHELVDGKAHEEHDGDDDEGREERPAELGIHGC